MTSFSSSRAPRVFRTAACLLSVMWCALTAVPAEAQPDAVGGTFSDIVTKGPWIDVRAFGADPTGKADSAAAFEAALAYAVRTNPVYFDARTYSRRIYVPLGHYRWSRGIVIPPSINVEIQGDGSPMGASTIIQYSGKDNTAGYLLDARSVLGFGLKNLTFVGQSDIADKKSACMQNGIITGRTGTFFNSANSWKNVTVFRFPGTGITFGRYAGYDGKTYPPDSGQTDNSQFDDLYVSDCRVGIVIDSPNFLQVHFHRLLVMSYGGNPVDSRGIPVEDGIAAPIKFRCSNALRVLYGHFSGTSIHLYAPFDDGSPEGQYALYVLDGSFNILSGYSESKYFAYVANGADDKGGTPVISTNTISNFRLYPGPAGGPDSGSKHRIYYDQQLAPLSLFGCDGLQVKESPRSAGVMAFGCRTETPVVSYFDLASLRRNPKSIDLGCSNMTYSKGKPHFMTNNLISNIGLSSYDDDLLATLNLSMRSTADSTYYLFADRDRTGRASGILLDRSGLSYFITKPLTNNAVYTKSELISGNEKFSVGTNGNIVIPSPGVPRSKTTLCRKGEIAWDNTHIYWCYSDNNWRRVSYDNSW